jgi:hypothetical protein
LLRVGGLARADAFGALRADDFVALGLSNKSGCLGGFFLVAVFAMEVFKLGSARITCQPLCHGRGYRAV